MRWCLLTLAVLILLSLTLAALHPRNQTVGDELLTAMDRRAKAEPVRSALLLFQFTPDMAQLDPLRRQPLDRGDGPLPHSGLTYRPDTHWIQCANAQFTWQNAPSAVDPLRSAIDDAQGDVRQQVKQTLTDARYYGDVAQKAMDDALASLAGLSDDELMQAWLRADRATLAQRPDLGSAVRDALLLTTHPTTQPILQFTTQHHQVYLLPLDPTSQAAWLQLVAHSPDGRFAWTGTIRISLPAPPDPPDPTQVRTLAALMAEQAASQTR